MMLIVHLSTHLIVNFARQLPLVQPSSIVLLVIIVVSEIANAQSEHAIRESIKGWKMAAQAILNVG